MIDASTTLGDVITSHPALTGELERRGLDYCCGGDRTLAAACTERGLDVAATLDELRAAAAATVGEAPDWASMGVAELVDHLEATHHRFLWDEVPRLSSLLDRIVAVHGERHPELFEVARRFDELRVDLEPHLAEEERVVFPWIRQLATGTAPLLPSGSSGHPLARLLAEHDRIGELFVDLRRLTDAYRPPPDGCASYRACYAGLAELEADTHLHVHKENNLLFPAVKRLAERLAGAPV